MTTELKGIQSNQDLLDEGWERRFLAGSDRRDEAVQLYEEMGFEVRAEELKPQEFGSGCASCASTVCNSYVLIYTRKKKPGTP